VFRLLDDARGTSLSVVDRTWALVMPSTMLVHEVVFPVGRSMPSPTEPPIRASRQALPKGY
jgi:hypothetical protein